MANPDSFSMDGHKDGVGCAGDSSMFGGECLAGEGKTPGGVVVKIEREEHGDDPGRCSCAGDDIMVEVLGSRVFVNGICAIDCEAGESLYDLKDDDGDGSIVECSGAADNAMFWEVEQNDGDVVSMDRDGSMGEAVKEETGCSNRKACEKQIQIAKVEEVCIRNEGRELLKKDLERSEDMLDLRDSDFGGDNFRLDSMEIEQASTCETGYGDTEQESAAGDVRYPTNGVKIVSEVNDTNGEELLGLEVDQKLKPQNGTLHELYSRAPREMETDKEEVEAQRAKGESSSDHPDGTVSTESDEMDQSARVPGEGAEYNILFDPNFDIANFIDFGGVISCPENPQHGKAEASAASDEPDSKLAEKMHEVAVSSALEEVSRQVELGLACSCLSNDAYDKIRFQILENSRIREESSMINTLNKFTTAVSFGPYKLVEYLKALAICPTGGFDELELLIAKAQLLAFQHVNGFHQPSSSRLCGYMQAKEGRTSQRENTHSKNDDKERQSTQTRSYHKRKHNLKDWPSCSSKRRFPSGSTGEKCESAADGAIVGEYLHRVTSQIASSPSLLRNLSNGYDLAVQKLPLDDLLAQILSCAQDPLGNYSFSNTRISFLSNFRNSVVLNLHPEENQGDKMTQSSDSIIASSEVLGLVDINDTYWTDRVIEEGCEGEISCGEGGYRTVPVELKPVVKPRRPYTRQRYVDSNQVLEDAKPAGYVDESAPAELIMNFPSMEDIPSKTHLSKMFRHFGKIVESQTEVDSASNRARVVFKKCSDAEVAFNSAGKFNIFGPLKVKYELNCTITKPFITSLFDVTIEDKIISPHMP